MEVRTLGLYSPVSICKPFASIILIKPGKFMAGVGIPMGLSVL